MWNRAFDYSGGMMVVLKTFGIFLVALTGEPVGTYAVWRWLRTGATPLLALVALAALFGYAVVQTLQPEDRYGRLFAAYAGVFLVGALLWAGASTTRRRIASTGSARRSCSLAS